MPPARTLPSCVMQMRLISVPLRPGHRHSRTYAGRDAASPCTAGSAQGTASPGRQPGETRHRHVAAPIVQQKTIDVMSEVIAEQELIAATVPQPERVMDKAIFEVVDVSDIPAASAPLRADIGRIGELWHALLELRPSKRLKVACRDRKHLGYTTRSLKEKAAKRGKAYQAVADGKVLFCWLEEQGR